MSKPIKELLIKELTSRLDGVDSLAVVGFTGIDAISTNSIRTRLQEKGIKLMVVKNSLAKAALKSVGMECAADLMEGPSALAFGEDGVVPVVRELLEIAKQEKQLIVKSAVLEGEAYRQSEIEALSKFPTREEAIAKVVGCVLNPGSKLAGCLVGPGRKIASLVKAIEEKQDDQAA